MPRTPCLPATSAKRPTAAGQTDAAPTAMPHPPIGRLPRRCRRSTVARYGGRISDTVRAARISTAGGRCTVRGGRERKTRHLRISFSFRAQPAANDPRSAASPNDRLYAERLSLDPRHERPISRSHPTERPNSEEDSNRGSSAVHALSNRLFRKAASPGIRPSDAFGHRAPPAGPVPQYACPAAETRSPGDFEGRTAGNKTESRPKLSTDNRPKHTPAAETRSPGDFEGRTAGNKTESRPKLSTDNRPKHTPAAETRSPGDFEGRAAGNKTEGRPKLSTDKRPKHAPPAETRKPGRPRRPHCRNQNGRSSGSSAGTDGAAGCP